MADALGVAVRRAEWADEADRLGKLREAVFVVEQGVPTEEEYDGLDPECIHVAAETGDGTLVGTGRLLPDGRIGRMAVEASWRGRGVGRAVLDALVACARERGFARVSLNAQVPALGFYERSGFRADGPVFDEAGIPHRRMTRVLEPEDE